MTHPSGRGCRQPQEVKTRLLGQIKKAEAELAEVRTKAVKAGIAGDYKASGKYTFQAQKLNALIFKLNCELDPVVKD